MLRPVLALAVLSCTLGLGGPAEAYDFAWSGKIELEAQGLKDADHERRRQAVQALGKYQISRVKPYLLVALHDDSIKVRQAAGRILARHKVAEAVPIVIEWLNDPSVDVKKTAADILAELGTKSARAALIRTLGDVDPDVRLRAVLALGQIGTSSVVVPLVGRLDDDKPNVRRHAIEQLQKIGDRRAVIPVVGAFNDMSLDVRIAAITAVGHLGDPAAVPALIRYVDDSLPKLRNAAVKSLGNLGATDAVDLLISRLHRTGQRGILKPTLAFALAKIVASPPQQGPKARRSKARERAAVAARARAATALVKALADAALHSTAGEALRTAGTAATPALIAHLQGRIDGDPEYVVQLLRDQPDPRATPALIEELGRGRVSQELVLAALARSGDSRATVPILSLLGDADTGTRMLAMQALGPLLAKSSRSADVIRRRLQDKNLEIRVLAADYLGRLQARAAVPQLSKLTAVGNELRLRQSATRALGEIGDRRAVPALVRILRHGPRGLYPDAANALIYIGDPGTVAPLLELLKQPPRPSAMPVHQLVRILGGVLRAPAGAKQGRGAELAAASSALLDLAREGGLRDSLAAISALGSIADKATGEKLRELARSHDLHRRRAALRALGDLGRTQHKELAIVSDALGHPDDRVAAAAARALAKLGARGQIKSLVRAAQTRGWATAINASATLAELAASPSKKPGSGLLAGELTRLTHHRVRFVRVNAAEGLGRLGDGASRGRLQQLLARDDSALVRVAALRALSRLPADSATRSSFAALAERAVSEPVREAAKAAHEAGFVPRKRSDWREFHVVDPDNGDAAVRQEAYFVSGTDGLVTAFYTDARGYASEEAFPPGPYVVGPKTASERF